MSIDPWDPEQYERFARERAQPFYDLVELVLPQDDMRVVDLGCGTGALTAELHQRLRARETLGLDSSPSMLAKCAEHEAAGLRFAAGEIGDFGEPGWDLVFSNAALHWVADHRDLLRRLAGCLSDRGQLAVQVPDTRDPHPFRTVAADVAATPPFRGALNGFVQPVHVLSPEDYACALNALGFARQHVRVQIYPHLLPSREHVVEWVESTTLSPYRRRMSPMLFAEYVARYRTRLFEHLPDERPFLFPYRRVLFWAQR